MGISTMFVIAGCLAVILFTTMVIEDWKREKAFKDYIESLGPDEESLNE